MLNILVCVFELVSQRITVFKIGIVREFTAYAAHVVELGSGAGGTVFAIIGESDLLVEYALVCAKIGNRSNRDLKGDACGFNAVFEVTRVGHANGNRGGITDLTVTVKSTVVLAGQPSRGFTLKGKGVGAATAIDVLAQVDVVICTRTACGNCRNGGCRKRLVADNDLLFLTCKALIVNGFNASVVDSGSQGFALIERVPIAAFCLSVLQGTVDSVNAYNTSLSLCLGSIDSANVGSRRTCGNAELLHRTVAARLGVILYDLERFAKPFGIDGNIACCIFDHLCGNAFTGDRVGSAPRKAAKLLVDVIVNIDLGGLFTNVNRCSCTQAGFLVYDLDLINTRLICGAQIQNCRTVAHVFDILYTGACIIGREHPLAGVIGGDEYGHRPLLSYVCNVGILLKCDLGYGFFFGNSTVRNDKFDTLRAIGIGCANGNAVCLAGLGVSTPQLGKIETAAHLNTLRKSSLNDFKAPAAAAVSALQIAPQINFGNALSYVSCRQERATVAHPFESGGLCGVSKYRAFCKGTVKVANCKIAALVSCLGISPLGRNADGGVEVCGNIVVVEQLYLTRKVDVATLSQPYSTNIVNSYAFIARSTAVIGNDGNVCARIFEQEIGSTRKIGRLTCGIKIDTNRYVITIFNINAAVGSAAQISCSLGISVTKRCKECSGNAIILTKVEVVVYSIADVVILIRERGCYIDIDGSAIQIEPSINTRKALGQVAHNVELAAQLCGYVQILGAAFVFYYDTVSTGIIQNRIAERNCVFSLEQDSECFFCLDGTTVVALKRQGSSLTVVAPALTRGIGAHFNGLATVDNDKLILFEHGTVSDLKLYVKVICRVPIVFAFVGKADSNTTCLAGRGRRAGNAGARNLIALRQLTLDHFTRPIAIAIIAGAANAGNQIDVYPFFKINGRNLENTLAAPNKTFGGRIGISKYRVLNGISVGVTKNEIAVVHRLVLDKNECIIGRRRGNGVRRCFIVCIVVDNTARQIDRAALLHCNGAKAAKCNASPELTAVVVGNHRYLGGAIFVFEVIDSLQIGLLGAR